MVVANAAPANLNWVEARGACKLSTVFEQLRADVMSDIEQRHNLRKATVPEVNGAFGYRFEIVRSSNSFTVLLHAGGIHKKSVTFILADAHIEVQNENSKLFDATIGLNDRGECTFRVKEQECYSWQIRKMALEELFFNFVTI